MSDKNKPEEGKKETKEVDELGVLRDEIVATVKEHQEKIDTQLREIEEKGQPNEALSAEIKSSNDAIERLRVQIEEIRKDVDKPGDPLGPKDLKSVSDQLYEENEEFKSFVDSGKGLNALPATGKLVFPVEGGFFEREKKTTITSGTVGSVTSGILPAQRVVDYIPAAERRLTMRDILPSRPISTNAVEFPKENVFTNMTSPQVEGNAKDEAALTFTIGTATVKTFAHWIPATSQVLDDWQALRRIIEMKLLYGLKLKEEEQIIAGAGTGSYLSGLTTNATAYAGTYNVANDTAIDKLRWAILEAEDDDEQPNFILVNPVNWGTILGVKNDEGGTSNTGFYVYGMPAEMNQPRTLWGKTVIVSNSMTSGYFLVGDRNMAEIFDRMQATVVVSTEHSDYFTKNLVAIRAEERIALAIYRTSAFIYGAF